MEICDTISTLMVEQAKLKLDLVGKPVDHIDYRSMIGSLMYLTSSRPDIMFATCMCARYQANPNEHYVSAVKRIFRYLKGTINLGLWHPKDFGFDLTAYSDADYAGCHLDRKILWMRTQLTDYGFFYDKVPIYCDSQSAIAISCNSVQHTRTKHIDVRYHFIKDHVEKGTIELYFVGTEYQLADLFTKSLPEARFKFLVEKLALNSFKTPKSVIHHEFIDTPGGSVYWVPRVYASVLSVLGTVYGSVEECISLYKKYASEADPKKNDRQVRSSNFRVCGCKARVVFDMVPNTKKYTLSTFYVEHNHELDRVEYKHLSKAEKELTYIEQLFIIKAANANIETVRAHNLYTGLEGSHLFLVQDGFVPFIAIGNHRRSELLIVSRIYDETDFKDKFGTIVWNMFIRPEEFADRWNKLMEEFNSANHKWLSKMYRIRSSWIPAFLLILHYVKEIVAGSWLCSIKAISSDEGCDVCVIDEEKPKPKHVATSEVIDKESTSENVEEEEINLHQKVTGQYKVIMICVKKPNKVNVKNPSGVKIKGHEKEKRIKGGRELSMVKCNKKKNGCGICKSTNHNRRTCPWKGNANVLYSVGVVSGSRDHGDGGSRDSGLGSVLD
ncbi:hypothetical protein Tco_0680635 [Tanacetum coccineum]|uniref:Protein FAR1-RELATED SEQUENCE n=1 Tax=Tanacetum coccineum TaxID=301880 RepID=A0ABQ4XLZ7_9ASTR